MIMVNPLDMPLIKPAYRSKNTPNKAELDGICKRFEEGICEVEQMFAVLDVAGENADRILRSQIILLVSTLDLFVHDVFMYGLLQIVNYEGNWRLLSEGNAFESEDMHGGLSNDLKYMDIQFVVLDKIISCYRKGTLCSEKIGEFLDDIRTKPSNVTSSGIRRNLKMINISIGSFPEDIHNGITDLANKRNCIVHHGGIDSVTGSKMELERSYIESGIAIVRKLGDLIKEAVKSKDSGN